MVLRWEGLQFPDSPEPGYSTPHRPIPFFTIKAFSGPLRYIISSIATSAIRSILQNLPTVIAALNPDSGLVLAYLSLRKQN